MKILHIIPGLQIGGAEIFLESLIAAWPRNGDQHVVVAFCGGVVAARLRLNNIVVHELLHHKPSSVIDFCRVFLRLSSYLIKNKPDVALSALWSANIFSRILCWFHKIPLVSIWHNNAQFLSVFARFLDVFTAVLFPGHIVAVAHSVKDSYVQIPLLGHLLGKRTTVVENGVDVEALLEAKKRHVLRQKFHLTGKRFVFGAVGRLIPVKAFSTLIYAFHAFLRDQLFLEDDMVEAPMLCIVGDGPEFDSLHGVVDQLKLTRFVTFCGQQEDVASLYHGFSAYVSASTSEGLSVAFLEALAVGLPFVVTQVCEPGALFSSGADGIVVESHEAVDLALGLIKMYSEYDEYARRSDSRTHFTRKFYSIARTAEKYVSLLTHLFPE